MGRVVRTLKHGWNVFTNPQDAGFSSGPSYSYRQNRSPVRYYHDRSIIGSIYTRLAVDFSQVEFFHAMLDENDVAVDIVRDSLNECLSLNPNVDQAADALKRDMAFTMFEEGVVAIVPTEANLDPAVSLSYDIGSLRTARITGWYPRKITVELYDDREVDAAGNPVNGGVTKQVTLDKRHVAIVENPFYNIMNTPNGTLSRLSRKLSQLDQLDDDSVSGKLDMIFQLPYAVRGDSRRAQAEKRRKDLADQLRNDELGIGYIDVSEKVIQLNRPINSSLPDEIKDLKDQLFAELGLTPEIMNSTASQDTMNSYYDRTIEPIANAVAQETKRKFLTKTARTQKHSIEIYRDPLKLIPISELAEVADKLTRNAIVTSNEFRPKIGFRPSKDPAANQLINRNMPMDDQTTPADPTPPKEVDNVKRLPGVGQAGA